MMKTRHWALYATVEGSLLCTGYLFGQQPQQNAANGVADDFRAALMLGRVRRIMP
jgi:hypothetical protein